MTPQAILQWLGVFEKIQASASGVAAFADVKRVLADHGIDADTSALETVIVDATRRQALAKHEAGDVGSGE